MKKSTVHSLVIPVVALGCIIFSSLVTFGQNEIVRETRQVAEFHQIEIGGAFDIELKIGSPQNVEVESKQKYINDISVETTNGVLRASAKGIRNNTPLNIYITVATLDRIELHGAASLKTDGTITSENLSVNVSGAADADLQVNVTSLSTEASGAADLDISGKAQYHSVQVSGAATLNARGLEAVNTDAQVSGAGTAKLNSEQVTGSTRGAGEIQANEESWVKKQDEVVIVDRDDEHDTTYVRVPGTAIIVSEGDDSVKVRIGNRVVIIDEDGDVKTHRCSQPKFNGHWAGFDIGFNGYVNPDFNMDFPKEYEYMDLRMEKSIAVNLNFFEQNIPFSKNQKWGMVTGLGLGFNDYRFMKPTRLSMDSSMLMGFLDEGISIRKSKLSAIYLSLPVLFEFQTAPIYHKNGFHISTGMIISARLSSHTKKYYNEQDQEFNITRYNPETDRYEVVYTAISPDDPKSHVYGDWFLQPFKFDATVRIGWNFLNFYATYSVNTMFRKDKGPELYPWSAGITLVAF